MGITKIILVRHGQTAWNLNGHYKGQSDVPLTERGKKQAELLRDHFPVAQVAAIYSSDLCRARVTAETIAEHFDLPVQQEPAFRELAFGDWESLTYQQIVEGWPEGMANFLEHPDIMRIPHGETFAEVQQRGMKRLRELSAKHAGGTFVVVCHGAILRTILCAVLGMPLANVWRIRQFNTAVDILTLDKDNFPQLELLNSTEHLPADMK